MGSAGQTDSVQSQQSVPRFVYVTNRDSHDVSAFRVDAVTGALSPVAGSPFATVAGPKSAVTSPDGKLLFVAGSSASSIAAFRINPSGTLTPVSGSPFVTEGEPRELAVDHAGKHLFVLSEERDSISVFAIEAETGGLSQVPGSPFKSANVPTGIAVGSGDRFVYVSYAADDSVAAFAVNETTGVLTPAPLGSVTTGAAPGKLLVSASGKRLFVANAGSDSISIFSVDPTRGELTPEQGSPMVGVYSPDDLLAMGDGAALYIASSQSSKLSPGLFRIAVGDMTGSEADNVVPAQDEEISSRSVSSLASDAAGLFLFAADTSSNTITSYPINQQTKGVDAGSGLSYGTGSSPSSIAVVDVAKPLVTSSISVALASEGLLTFASTTGSVTLSAPAVNQGVTGCAGQIIQLAFSVPSIGVISTAAENPATSVCVLTGKDTGAFNVTTDANSGSATLTAFATGFTDGTTNLSVSLRTISLSLPSTTIGVGHPVTGTVILANPAPSGSAKVSLATSAAQTATVSPASVTISAGASSATFTVTGVSANTAALTASVPSGGYSNGTLGITVLPPALTINLPHNAVVAPGESLPYPITIGAAAAAAVSVSFTTSGGPGTATISPNPVVIPKGATAPTTSPTIKGGHIGPLTVTGGATGFASDTENAIVQISLTLTPSTLSVETGKTANLTLSASAVAPAGGFVINLAFNTAGIASVTNPITIPSGSSSVSVPINGVAAGSTTLNASAPGAIPAAATINVFAPPRISLSGPSGTNSFTVGKDGVVSMFGTLAQAAPQAILRLLSPQIRRACCYRRQRPEWEPRPSRCRYRPGRRAFRPSSP